MLHGKLTTQTSDTRSQYVRVEGRLPYKGGKYAHRVRVEFPNGTVRTVNCRVRFPHADYTMLTFKQLEAKNRHNQMVYKNIKRRKEAGRLMDEADIKSKVRWDNMPADQKDALKEIQEMFNIVKVNTKGGVL